MATKPGFSIKGLDYPVPAIRDRKRSVDFNAWAAVWRQSPADAIVRSSQALIPA